MHQTAGICQPRPLHETGGVARLQFGPLSGKQNAEWTTECLRRFVATLP